MHMCCLFQLFVEMVCRQDATKANCDRCLKPFKCVTGIVGHDDGGFFSTNRSEATRGSLSSNPAGRGSTG